MKTLIIALNSKYIHSSLAPWYLKYACGDCCGDIKVLEYSINDDIEWILSKIYFQKPDIAAFSCYIWNINHILRIAENLKKVLPNITIILGGPEVSYTPKDIMSKYEYIDFIICGEGEESFKSLLKKLYDNFNINTINTQNTILCNGHLKYEIDGVCYRINKSIVYDGKYCQVKNLDSIPSPYTKEMINSIGSNRIVYYEASRGCPFSCSYCLSSTFDGVRYFSMKRVKEELFYLINAGVKQVKFVDRTFNCSKEKAKEIIKFVGDNSENTNFHFEVAADLFDDEMLEILSEVPEGIIQLEIGIQTTNTVTLSEINRKTNINKVFNNIKRLMSKNNVHLHLDLIAGLPYEDYVSFQDSFNSVYALKPHQLQLGFLKMLKGSQMRNESCKHEYVFREYPPYEVLYNKYISFSEITELKGIEEIFERYYNSGRFINSLNFIIDNVYDSPFSFYRKFYLYNLEHGYIDKPISGREQYTVFMRFAEDVGQNMPNQVFNYISKDNFRNIISDLLKLDYLSTNNTGNLPEGINRVIESGFKEKCHNFLKDKNNIAQYLPNLKELTASQILKKVRFETFNYDVLSLHNNRMEDFSNNSSNSVVILFDYSSKHKVTGAYNHSKIISF